MTETAATTNTAATTATTALTDTAPLTATAAITRGPGVTSEVTIALFADVAPVAVNNFVTLANLGFYDGTPVNISNADLLVIGSPDDSLAGAVGYRIVPEVNLPQPPVAGSIAWAPEAQTAAGIETNGSILMIAKTPPPAESAASYGFFGKVVSGLDALTQLQQGDLIQSIKITASK